MMIRKCSRYIKRLAHSKGGRMTNLEAVTVQDCIDLYRMKGKCTVINDGRILGFIEKDWKEMRDV